MLPQKNTNIERLRIISCLGIITFHCQNGLLKTIGYISLPTFVILTFALGLIKEQTRPIQSKHFFNYIRSKSNRLIKPYIFWVIIYGCWGLLRNKMGYGKIIELPISFLFPLYGTSIHLWYLPFTFLGLTSISYLKYYPQFKRIPKTFTFFLFLTIFGLAPIFLENTAQLPIPQILFALPAAILGLYLHDNDNPSIIDYGSILLIIVIIGLIRLNFNNSDFFIFQYSVAYILVVFCLNIPGKINKFTEHISELTFGIYLIHPLIIAILNNITTPFTYVLDTPLKPLIIFTISATCIHLSKYTVLIQRIFFAAK